MEEPNLDGNTQPAATSAPQSTPESSIIKTVIIVGLISGLIGGFAGSRLSGTVGDGTRQSGNQNQNITLTEQSAVTDVVKQASPAVVSIVVTKDLSRVPGFGGTEYPFFFGRQNLPSGPQQVGAGSGFFISADGTIVTNKHVVSDERAGYTVLTSDNQRYEAKVLALDPRNDLALLKIEIKDASYLKLADTTNLQVGQTVIAIGNSLGQYQNTVTTGVVSGIGRSITAGGGSEGIEQLEGVIQTDAAINPGNSGGPLLNIAGQVIGVNTAIDREGQSVGFAIPAKDVDQAVRSFQKSGKITRPTLGVRYVVITKELAQREQLPKDYGALIIRGDTPTSLAVIPGSPADKAGLKENDIILELNGTKIDEQNTLSKLIKNLEAGATITLKIYRQGAEMTVSATLSDE